MPPILEGTYFKIEIVHHQGETDWLYFMFPEWGGVLTWMVVKFCDIIFNPIVRNFTHLFDPWGSLF